MKEEELMRLKGCQYKGNWMDD